MIEKSISNKSKFSNKLKKRTAHFNKKYTRKSSDVIPNIQFRNLDISERLIPFDKKHTDPIQSHKLEDYQFE